ncbi:MAG: DnaJ domain-containing protein [Clostridia bacterium]|nr:DnaJ domain-containing protein [Clostridia bacterium]
MKNYYEILEVNEKASQEIISKVFKMHIKKWHPDLYQGDEKIKAENKTKEINEAYSVLSDETKRANYDMELQNEKNILSGENYELEMLKEENEMLKRSIEKRDQIINNLIHPSSETSKRMHYYNEDDYYDEEETQPQYTAYNQDYNQNYSQNDDNNEYSNPQPSVKDFMIKVIICFLILLIGSIIIYFLIKNLPLFNLMNDIQ